jgi:hypothetical protein
MTANLFPPSPTMQKDTPALRAFYWILALVTAAAQILCAMGSGSSETTNPKPDWVNTGANVLNLFIAVLVLLPRTRLWGALAAALMMILSMITNVQVDGYDYFLKVLPFDLGALAVAAWLAWHHRADFRA